MVPKMEHQHVPLTNGNPARLWVPARRTFHEAKSTHSESVRLTKLMAPAYHSYRIVDTSSYEKKTHQVYMNQMASRLTQFR